MLEARASTNSLGTQLYFHVICKEKNSKHRMKTYLVFQFMVVFFPLSLQLNHTQLDPESLTLQDSFNSGINFFSAIRLPPSAKNQEYLWPTLFYHLAGDNIQFDITHLVQDTKLASGGNRATYLTFTCLTNALKETSLRFALHRSPQKTKHTDGPDDYMPPLIMFSNLRTVCTCERMMDILGILIRQKDELSINTVQISVLSTQI